MVDYEPRTFSYIRASTGKQQITAEVQRDTIGQFIECRSQLDSLMGRPTLPPLSREFIDALEDHQSGKVPLADRPAGGELLAEVRSGDHVIVARLDRLGRKALDILASIDALEKRGVIFHFLNFGGAWEIDTSTPAGKLFLTSLAGHAEFERAMIADRTKLALRMKRRNGFATCMAPTGMKIVKTRRANGDIEKRYAWDKRKLKEAEIAKRMRGEVISLAKIADYLNAIDCAKRRVPHRKWDRNRWDKSTIRRMLIAYEKYLTGICPVKERADSAG